MIENELSVMLADEGLPGLIATFREQLEHGTSKLTPEGIARVRRSLPESWQGHSNLAIELVLGTQKAMRLGKHRSGWLFTQRMAEQATHPSIASYHAAPFEGCRHVVEVCTGAGVDAAALSLVANIVTTYEADSTVAMIASGNLARSGLHNVEVVCEFVPGARWKQTLQTADGIWADPSRRDESGRRRRSTADYSPAIRDVVMGASNEVRIGVKIGPADIVEGELGNMSRTWIGWRSEARECVLWRNMHEHRRNHVVLIDAEAEWQVPTTERHAALRNPREGDVIVEPHAAIIASGHVGAWFAEQEFSVLDTRIAYGLKEGLVPESPWYQRFQVVRVDVGVDEKRIQRAVSELGWGPTSEIKKRGVNVDPMDVHRKIRWVEQGQPGVILLARTESGRLAIYARRPEKAANNV